jgi:hypothetical protein
MAITYNNLSVLALKQGNYTKAIKSAKLAVSLMEPQIFQVINEFDISNNQPNNNFTERLQVLLIGYFNLGVSQAKANNGQYSKKVFDQGFRVAKRFLGEDHFFTQKFARKLQSPATS